VVECVWRAAPAVNLFQTGVHGDNFFVDHALEEQENDLLGVLDYVFNVLKEELACEQNTPCVHVSGEL